MSDPTATTPPSGWAVLNSPMVVALLTSGLLAALGASYTNFRLDRELELSRREEMLLVTGELRARAQQLEVIDVALLQVGSNKEKRELGAMARKVRDLCEISSCENSFCAVAR